MAEKPEEVAITAVQPPSMMDKIKEKLHVGDNSSSSSDDDKKRKLQSSLSPSDASSSASRKANIYRLLGRDKPIHTVLGGGKPADMFLWRNKKISAGVLGGATAAWVLLEQLEFQFLTLASHCLILAFAVLLLWSNASIFIHKSPPHIPEVSILERQAVDVALSLWYEINRALAVLREIASGRDLRKFLAVIAGSWVLSVLGSCCSFLTLFYIAFVVLHTLPVLYEKYEDKVDSFAEKSMVEIKKKYAVFDSKVLYKIPRAPLKDKNH